MSTEMMNRNDKEPCVFCCGTGRIDFFDEVLHDFVDEVCEDCAGTGVDDDEEGL